MSTSQHFDLAARVHRAIRTRHYSRKTEKSYLGWIRRFVRFLGRRPIDAAGPEEIRRFLSDLATLGKVSASTQNQALCALLFLYREVLGQDIKWVDDIVRAKRVRHLPVVLGREEVRAVIKELAGTPRLMALLLYGAGLRLMECVRLRVKDVDLAANQMVVRGGKGGRDRVALLPVIAKPDLGRNLESVYRQHRADLARGGATTFTNRSFSERSRRQCGGRGSQNPRRATRFGTHLPRTCWRTATTSGPCRSCWATGT